MEEIHPLTKIVWNQFKRSKDFWASEYEAIDNWDLYWESSPDVVSATKDWEDKIHVPLTFGAEQVLTPRIHAVITATDPPFDVVGVEKRDDRGAISIKHLEGHHFKLSDFDGKSVYYVRQAAARGTTIAQVFWNLKERYLTNRGVEEEDITELDPVTGEQIVVGKRPVTRKRTKKAKIRNHPDFEVFSVKDAFPDPDSVGFEEDLEDLPFIRRQKVSFQKLKDWNEIAKALGIDEFQNLDKLEEEIITKKKKDEEVTTQVNITLLHYWGVIDLSKYEIEVKENLKEKMLPSWITIGYTDENEESLKGKYFIRAIENPYYHGEHPFVKSVWIKKKTPSWFGIGIAQAGQSSADRVNDIVNMRQANIKRIINKRFFYDVNDVSLDLDAAERGEPGVGIGMRDTIRSMVWEQIGDVTQSSYLEEKMAKQDFQEATGAVAAITPGGRSEQHATVRGMMLLQGQAGERLKIIAKDIEGTFNKRLSQMYHELSKQFMKKKEVFDILGEDGKYYPFEVSPEDIVAKVNFRTTGVSEIVSREMQINQLLQFKQLTMNDPTIDKAEINRRIAILFGFKDLDSLIRKLSPEQEVQLMSMMGGKGATTGATTGALPMPSPEGAGRPEVVPEEKALSFEGTEERV